MQNNVPSFITPKHLITFLIVSYVLNMKKVLKIICLHVNFNY